MVDHRKPYAQKIYMPNNKDNTTENNGEHNRETIRKMIAK